MLFTISDTFVVFCDHNHRKDCPQLTLFGLKCATKTAIDVDVNDITADNAKQLPTNDYQIICGNLSQRGDYLAVCDNRKNLIVFELADNRWTQIFRTKVSRNCIKVLFSLTKKSVICGHKSGDVFEHDFGAGSDGSVGGRLLLGHCSMLLDLIQTCDSKYLITSDRDEKIRVSHYPNTYNIESYCLGHKEFVASIDTINNETIVSGSGDGSIRVWNALDGKQVSVLMCDPNETIDTNGKSGTQFPVKKLVTNDKRDANLLSVSFYKQNMIKVFSIDSLSLKLIHTLALDEEPIDIEFDRNRSDILWVVSAKAQNMVTVYEISSTNITKANIYENVIKELNASEGLESNCVNESKDSVLDGLYKHWFNNVETYLQKKLERQEEVNKKKKFSKY